ncbi:MAG TPA: electron transport complex subunit RsxC [Firmicutes bacterium]|uniref:Ion-translocating oxidoreductase complex subunit C n=1 Tax=Capillibacterium thermochitinicola TaxID=2699427 RepID=A0A8J6I0P8_9FIRM|nr:electron transport complex subunit RsxC [Capillibacterium thermochitinicola]MBA2133485.1 electron transport complex subunit RsxC [Capillibacterium thermochitinicola]HHW11621.1 electron transport complex subunit RsxC [Bacillota bacterium]
MGLKTFKKGIHPPTNKELTASLPVEELPLPAQVVLPLGQHIGAPAKPLVAVGDEVATGQKIAEAQGGVSVPLHASISGKVVAIEPRPHASGQLQPAIVIESDGADRRAPDLISGRKLEELTADEIKALMKEAGLVGMGGAAFPTHVKYCPPETEATQGQYCPVKPVDYVILNGVECEPYLTCDHRLMLEQTADVIRGLLAFMKAAGAPRGIIGVEANKPDAIEALRKAAAGYPVEVVPLKVKYPQGEERMLIYAATRRKVPVGALPIAVGVIVNNVATAAAFGRYLREGMPLIDRIVTVTGTGIKTPKNLRVRIGTLLEDVINYCGGFPEPPGRIILGGPMTGPAIYRLDVPIMKGTSGILVQTRAEVKKYQAITCIRCGKCVDACPYNLLPNYLADYAEHGKLGDAEKYGLFDCRECGACAYVCPSRRPLLQLFKNAKQQSKAAQKKR